MKMKFIYLIAALTSITSTIFAEMRLTLNNETPYDLKVYYTTGSTINEDTALEISQHILKVPLPYGSVARNYRGEPVIIPAHTSKLLYHAGAMKGFDLIINPYQNDERITFRPDLTKKTIKELYLVGNKNEPYSLQWLYEQVWQDGDRWNWTLTVKEQERLLTEEEITAYSQQ